MSPLSLWDHAFVLIVLVLYPAYSTLTIDKVFEDIRARGEPAKISAYRQTIRAWLVFALALIAMWALLDRNSAELGLRLPGLVPFAVATGVATTVVALVLLPLRNLARSPEKTGDLADLTGDVALLMPRSATEQSWFARVAINAGLCEELIFRGYLIWYLEHFLGFSWTVVIAALWFGFAHLYQGLRQLPGLLLVSGVAVFLFVYTDSLLVPVLFHIVLDILQGRYLAKIQRSSANAG